MRNDDFLTFLCEMKAFYAKEAKTAANTDLRRLWQSKRDTMDMTITRYVEHLGGGDISDYLAEKCYQGAGK